MSATYLEEEQQQIGNQLQELQKQLNECIERGDYGTAKRVQEQIKNAKEQLKKNKSNIMKSAHDDTLRSIDNAFDAEVNNFNMTWEKRLDEYNTNAAQRLDALKQQMNESLQKIADNFKAKPPRFSKQIINLRQQEVMLAKAGKFDEAQAVQKYADEIETKELMLHQQSAEGQREQEVLKALKFYEAQGKVLIDKIEKGRSDLLTKWAQDMDRLRKHHDTQRRIEEKRHNIESSGRNVYIQPDTLGASKSKAKIENIISPTKQYIEDDGLSVNASMLGASMSPVVSKVHRLQNLRVD